LLGDKENDVGYPPMMILTGQAGDGKTMLLGKFVLTIEVKFQKTFLSIYFNIYIK
jgi:hypothetical protein